MTRPSCEQSYGSFLMTKNRLESHIFEFFKNRSLNNVTVIMLEEFVGYLTLARNARTSVEMFEKFYASTLSAEMNIALLHGKRR
jgi:hypothetical protein